MTVSVIIPAYNREDEILACVKSITLCSYSDFEIIVVDDASQDRTVQRLRENFPSVTVIQLAENSGASVARNEGVKHARGKYLCFVDSDNVVHKEVLSELIKLAEADARIGFVGPKTYYLQEPNRIWYAGAEINLLTSRTIYTGSNEIDNGQYDSVREVGHIPNLYMVRRDIIDKVGLIDTGYVMHYEESDWAMRAKRAGYKIVFCPFAIAYHNIPLPESKTLRGIIGFDNKYRIYYAARNRIVFMKKHAGFIKFVFFSFIFNNIFLAWYVFILLRYKRVDLICAYLRGYFDGLTKIAGRT